MPNRVAFALVGATWLIASAPLAQPASAPTVIAALNPVTAPEFAAHPQAENLVLNLPPRAVSVHTCPIEEKLISSQAVEDGTGRKLNVEIGLMVEKDGQQVFSPSKGRTGVHYADAFRLPPHNTFVRVIFTCVPPLKGTAR